MSKPARDRLYILTTEPRQEFAARKDLARLGFDAYAPSMRYQRRIRGRYRKFGRAMIPGYVFVVADETDDPAIRHADGITGVLAEMDDEGRTWLTQVLLLEGAGEFDTTIDRRPKIKLGDFVKIIHGKWAALGYAGKVSRIEGKKLSVTVETANGQKMRYGMPVKCDTDAVELAA